jgi:hypothetical protein
MRHSYPLRVAHSRAMPMLALVLSACATPAQRGIDSASAEKGAPVNDPARLAQLEREARALVKTTGCSAAASCRTAPLGWRGCGGPRAFLVYCPATTDSVALFRKLEELRQAEIDYNAKSGMMSTCEMRLPPNVTLEGGSCTASR